MPLLRNPHSGGSQATIWEERDYDGPRDWFVTLEPLLTAKSNEQHATIAHLRSKGCEETLGIEGERAILSRGSAHPGRNRCGMEEARLEEDFGDSCSLSVCGRRAARG